MDPFLLLNFSWIVTLVAIIAISVIPSKNKAWLAAIAVTINAILTSIPAVLALGGIITDISVSGGAILGGIPLRIDGLSAWFILIINFTSVTGAFYGIGYLKEYANSTSKLSLHWSLFTLFHISMVWVCILQNGFAFLIAWEIMSLSSMLLVIFDHDNAKTLKAGINYLVQMHISVVFLTVGFIWIYARTGSLSFDAIRTFFQNNNNLWVLLLFFIGFGLKAGFIPFHSWLPLAHPAAPSHVSGVMSGVIVKLGIYGIIRMISYLQSDFILLGGIIISLSVLTGVYGIINASVHRDLKKMLAYCTIENIGIIGIGIGIGLIGMGNGSSLMFFLGFGGALLHVLNHSLFKSLLFYSAGSVYQQSHTRNMEQLGGLGKIMPKTSTLFLIGAIAIGGLPPFNGFISEFIIYSGLVEGIHDPSLYITILMILVIAGLSVIGGLSVLTFTKTYGAIFLGSPRKTLHNKPHEVSRLMLIPQYIIIVVMLSVAIVPQFYLNSLQTILIGMSSGHYTDTVHLEFYSKITSNISLIFLLLIGFTGLIWIIRSSIMKHRPQAIDATWGCGYTAPNSSMQYTGKSFSKPLGKLFNFLLIEKKDFTELKTEEIFPEKRKYESHYVDFFERYIIDPTIWLLQKVAGYFRFIQNGRTQSYVLYGIIFIIIMVFLTVFNIIK